MISKLQIHTINLLNEHPKKILFLILIIIFNPSGYLTGNEQAYFEQSYNYFDNGVSGYYSNYFDKNHTILLFATISNFLISNFGFYISNIILSLFLCYIFSYSILKLTSFLKFKPLNVLTTILIFILVDQSFIAHSWIIGAVEPKAFAYGVVILSISYYLKSNYNWSILYLILGSYFHILIGMQIALIYFLHILFIKKNLNKLIIYCFLYIVLVLPYVIFIYLKSTENNSLIEDNLPDPNWIYSIFRLSHHTAIFSNANLFFSQLPGIVCLICTAFLNYKYFLYEKKNEIKNFLSLNYLILIFIIFGLLISLIFNNSGLLGKLFLLRLNSLSLFFILLFLTDKIITQNVIKKYSLIILLFCSVYILEISKNFVKDLIKIENNSWKYLSNDQINLIKLVKNQVKKNEVIIFANTSYTDFFEEEVGRNLYVTYKNNPTNNESIKEWYRRLMIKQDLKIDKCDDYNEEINYILFYINDFVKHGFNYKCGEYISNYKNFVIYKLN